jgi:hypothetical protein
MYYIIESEGHRERRMFRRYQSACMAALELARYGRLHEVRVIRLATAYTAWEGRFCVYITANMRLVNSQQPNQTEPEAVT